MQSETTPPEQIQAVRCHRFDTPEALGVETVARPVPGKGEVAVRVEAAGVNYADALMVQGKYQASPEFPFTPGSEIAGTVAAVGEGVTSLAPGDRVMAFTGTGGFAEVVVVEAWRAFRIPDAMASTTAAGFLVPYGTAWLALLVQGRMRAGETVLVTGAGGGVGSAAIEIAKARGCRVLAIASGARKLEAAQKRGADEVIDAGNENLRGILKEMTAGHGIDIVLDTVGGKASETLVRNLATHGRYLVIGFAAGQIPSIPLNLLLLKSSSIIGVYWGAEMRRDPQAGSAMMLELLGEVEGGRLTPDLPEVLKLDQVGTALRRLTERKVIGKVVLVPGKAEGA